MNKTQNAMERDKSTMALKEPRRKRRVRLRPRKPFPISIGSNDEWTVYTGHLSHLGVCVTDLCEIEALHSMGFFGKGSLSRSYPNFQKTRGGVPPIVRQRQWARRQAWLEQAKTLDSQAIIDDIDNREFENVGQLDSEEEISPEKEISNPEEKSQSGVSEVDNVKTNKNISEHSEEVVRDIEAQNSDKSYVPLEKRFNGTSEKSDSSEKNSGKGNTENHTSRTNECDDDVVISEIKDKKLNYNPLNSTARLYGSQTIDKKSENVGVDEVVLCSSEEEDEICEISNIETTAPTPSNVSCNEDIILINDETMPMDLGEKNTYETENTERNTEDDIEILESDILVLPDSDSDEENYLSKVKPAIKKEGFPVRETLHLTFEETFFLMFGLGCLQIVDFDGNLLDISDAWNHFCRTQNDFVQRYVVYHYFRSKGWVVKPGLKYGGDFLLYKQGPPFYHASYIVIVEVLNADTFLRDEEKTTRTMTWKKLFGLDRLSETAAKEILFAQVLWPFKIPRSEIPSTPELLAEFTVRELLYRRWIPKQKREEIDLEDDNDELHK